MEEAVALSRKVDGWLDLDEMRWLYTMASRLPAGSLWVEVGSWKGRSLVATALGLKLGCQFLGIDHFGGNPESTSHGEAAINGWLQSHCRIAADAVMHLNPGVQVGVVRATSADGPALLEGRQPDVVFLDGSHTYPAIKADIRIWWPLLKVGGFLCGHDAHPDYPGVLNAVNRYLPWFPAAGSIWYARKESDAEIPPDEEIQYTSGVPRP